MSARAHWILVAALLSCADSRQRGPEPVDRLGGTVTGRAVVRGAPAPLATVILRERTLAELRGWRDDESDAYFEWMDGGPSSPFDFDELQRTSVAGANGSFRFDGLTPGVFRLEIHTAAGDRRSIEPVAVLDTRPTLLGDVELVPGSSFRGRVVVPSGCAAGDIEVFGWVFDQERRTRTDAGGGFSFQDIPTGRLTLAFGWKPGVLVAGPYVRLDLRECAAREVELDLRDRAGCFVDVEIADPPERDLRVSLEPIDRARSTVEVGGAPSSGPQWVEAIGPVDGVVLSATGLPLAVVPRIADLAPNGEVAVRFRCPIGFIESKAPDPPQGERRWLSDRYSARAVGLDREFRANRLQIAKPPQRGSRGAVQSDSWVHHIGAGEYDWSVTVCSETSDGKNVFRTYRRRLTVRPGELVACTFTEADRVP